MISISVCLILFFLSVSDIKKQKIPVWLLMVAGTTAVILRIIWTMKQIEAFSAIGLVVSLMPGCIFLVLAFVTREQIGYGDGIVLCIMGVLCPFWKLMMILGMGLSISSFASILLLMFRKGNRCTRIPFLPFLWIGTLLEMILENNRL